MIREIDFTLALCQYIKPDEEKICAFINSGLDYPYILGQLLYNRVGGAAYYTLNSLSLLGKMNREFRNSLKTVYDTNKTKSDSFKEALESLHEVFKQVDFPYALLKGSFLVSLYPSGLRTSNDIDVLINFKDSAGISKLLTENGFIQGHIRNNEIIKASRTEIISSQLNRGEAVPFVKEVNLPYMKFLEVDVNFSLGFKPDADKGITERLLTDIVTEIKTQKGALYTLSPPDFLIQLCTHLYKEASVYNWVAFGRDQGLYKYLDIYLFVLEYLNPNTTEAYIRRIKALGVENECYYALNGTKELFSLCATPELDLLLMGITPEDLAFLNEVYSPADGKKYRYDLNFKEWVFDGRRREKLNEVKT